MMPFFDREEERNRLRRLLQADAGALACLYGRRRCGKTRLLHECTDNLSNAFYFLADRSERAAQLSRFVKEVARQLPVFSAAATNDWGSVLDLWVGLAPRGSVLVLDEFPYLVEKDESLPSVLQRIVDGLPKTGHKIIICGSSQRMMQGFVLKSSEPLYGRAQEILPIRPLGFEWLSRAFPRMTPFERLQTWGVWGGVPRYWELQAGEPDLWTAVCRHVASPLGVLRNEPQFLLLDDLEDVTQASSVLAFIGEGAHRASEIAARLQRPVTDLSRPLNRLTELGLISKDIPFDADEKSKKSFYRIRDPFLDFWYTFIWPNWSREDFLSVVAEREEFERVFSVHLGGVWERLVCECIMRQGIPEIDSPARVCRRWWGVGANRVPMEIDVVAESQDGHTLLVGEAKLALTPVEAEHALAELQAKARQLPFVGRYERIVTRLFVAKGGSYDCSDLVWASTSK